MNLSVIEKEDLEDIVCDMLRDLKTHEMQLYTKFKNILDDIVYGIDEEEAVDIVHSFKPSGEAFSIDKVREILHRNGKTSEEDCINYYLTMNMMYNDYKPYMESRRLDIQEFCMEMSRLFIEDIDAPKHKVSRYFKMYLDDDDENDN